MLRKKIKLERILTDYDILFAERTTGELVLAETIIEIINRNYNDKLVCDTCGRRFKEDKVSDIHHELLYCNHDGTINLNLKKHLTREKNVRLYNAQLRLTRILDNVQESLSRHYDEWKIKAKPKPMIPKENSKDLKGLTVTKMKSKKRKCQN